jgi:hypothetical protein
MKLNLQEATQRLNILSVVPVAKLKQSTRIKIIRAQVELEKVNTAFQSDLQEGLKKLKPEGFDDRYQKYAEAIEGKDTDAAKEQAEAEGFEDFKAEYEKVDSEYRELYNKSFTEQRYSCNVPMFNDAELEDFANALPAGEALEVERPNIETKDNLIKISCDEIMINLVRLFS